jgi:tetratricopeptide (TPR) repeat protein
MVEYERVIDLARDSGDEGIQGFGHVGRALVYYNGENYDAAMQELRQARKLDTMAEVDKYLALTEFQRGNRRKALRAVRKYLRRWPFDVECRSLAADLVAEPTPPWRVSASEYIARVRFLRGFAAWLCVWAYHHRPENPIGILYFADISLLRLRADFSEPIYMSFDRANEEFGIQPTSFVYGRLALAAALQGRLSDSQRRLTTLRRVFRTGQTHETEMHGELPMSLLVSFHRQPEELVLAPHGADYARQVARTFGDLDARLRELERLADQTRIV